MTSIQKTLAILTILTVATHVAIAVFPARAIMRWSGNQTIEQVDTLLDLHEEYQEEARRYRLAKLDMQASDGCQHPGSIWDLCALAESAAESADRIDQERIALVESLDWGFYKSLFLGTVHVTHMDWDMD